MSLAGSPQMKIESISLKNFRCFGPVSTRIQLSSQVTTLIGPNGAGKTAALLALLRLFGPSEDLRKLRPSDFYVPPDEQVTPAERKLRIEVILGFPELKKKTKQARDSVPPFFSQMAANKDGDLKCRIVLDGTWTEDGTADGAVEARASVVRTLDDEFTEEQSAHLMPSDRGRIQVVYVPASRDASAQVTSLLRGRIWRAIQWSKTTKAAVKKAADDLAKIFDSEPAVNHITKAIRKRWSKLHDAGTDTTPAFRPMDRRFEDFIRKVELVFQSDELGRDRGIAQLSDGQRSMLHLAMTASVMDVEQSLGDLFNGEFNADLVPVPALTVIAVEEPENCLAPFYLSRIISQVQELASRPNAQALVSSHSASILGRTDPEDIRHFRLDPSTRIAAVRRINMPAQPDESAKFVREAVQAYPELYFARLVILGEGASEKIVLPRIAAAMGLEIDTSFVAVVPLGGRHVQHMWRLLEGLNIPHLTLLDFDLGRHGGAWGRLKTVMEQLRDSGMKPADLLGEPGADATRLKTIIDTFANGTGTETSKLASWRKHLECHGVFFSYRLDLDWMMMRAFPSAYQVLGTPGSRGPKGPTARKAVLGAKCNADLYPKSLDRDFAWYRYLFVNRGKPATHLSALARIPDDKLKSNSPRVLKRLLAQAASMLAVSDETEPDDILI